MVDYLLLDEFVLLIVQLVFQDDYIPIMLTKSVDKYQKYATCHFTSVAIYDRGGGEDTILQHSF